MPFPQLQAAAGGLLPVKALPGKGERRHFERGVQTPTDLPSVASYRLVFVDEPAGPIRGSDRVTGGPETGRPGVTLPDYGPAAGVPRARMGKEVTAAMGHCPRLTAQCIPTAWAIIQGTHLPTPDVSCPGNQKSNPCVGPRPSAGSGQALREDGTKIGKAPCSQRSRSAIKQAQGKVPAEARTRRDMRHVEPRPSLAPGRAWAGRFPSVAVVGNQECRRQGRRLKQ
jgi:hypothetical protein